MERLLFNQAKQHRQDDLDSSLSLAVDKELAMTMETNICHPPLLPILRHRDTMELPHDGDVSFLDQYPSIALDQYEDTGDFWYINKEYPGLRAISKDPWIFLVPNLLSREQCEALMTKGGSRVEQCMVWDVPTGTNVVNEDRTSWDMRIPNAEVQGIQPSPSPSP